MFLRPLVYRTETLVTMHLISQASNKSYMNSVVLQLTHTMIPMSLEDSGISPETMPVLAAR